MKYAVGETVIIKKSGIKVKIRGFLNPKVVEVVAGDKQFPVHINDLSPDIASATNFWHPKKKQDLKEKPISKTGNQQRQTEYFAFILQADPVSENNPDITTLAIGFTNQSSATVSFGFHIFKNGNSATSGQSRLLPEESESLTTINLKQTPSELKIAYDIRQVANTENHPPDSGFHFKQEIKFSSSELFQKIQKTGQKRLEIPIVTLERHTNESTGSKKQQTPKPVSGKPNFQKTPKQHSATIPITNEIDLHAEALGIPITGLDNFEIIRRQLHALEVALDKAVVANQTSLIIIHGLGKGKLKEEVHQLLKSHPAVTFFQHSWRPKYGYGATEAFLK